MADTKMELKKDEPKPLSRPVKPQLALNLLDDTNAKLKLKMALQIAGLVKDVIVKAKLFTDIKGNRYVFARGWKLLANMCGFMPEVDDTKTRWERTVENDIKVLKVYCVARLKDKAGNFVGTSEAMCSSLEANWRGRDEFAIHGMAQTRAIGRACKNSLDWLMTLAGYAEVPADEVTEGGLPGGMSQREKETVEVGG